MTEEWQEIHQYLYKWWLRMWLFKYFASFLFFNFKIQFIFGIRKISLGVS